MGKTSKNPAETIIVRSGVGVVLEKDRKLLVGKRLSGHGAGLYSFPGGHIEPQDAAKKHPLGGFGAAGEREVYEETGITCLCYSPDNCRPELFTNLDILSEDGNKIYVTPYLMAAYLHGPPEYKFNRIKGREPSKCEEWEWMDLERIVRLVQSEEQKAWIPIHQVLFYLKQLWRLT